MKNTKNWLNKKGYEFKVDNYNMNGDIKQCIMVDNNYSGLYPTQEAMNNLNTIRAYISKHQKNFKVESRGNCTGILISPR